MAKTRYNLNHIIGRTKPIHYTRRQRAWLWLSRHLDDLSERCAARGYRGVDPEPFLPYLTRGDLTKWQGVAFIGGDRYIPDENGLLHLDREYASESWPEFSRDHTDMDA